MTVSSRLAYATQGFRGGGGTVVLEGLTVELMAEPDILLEDEVTITLEPDSVDIIVDPDIDIEAD